MAKGIAIFVQDKNEKICTVITVCFGLGGGRMEGDCGKRVIDLGLAKSTEAGTTEGGIDGNRVLRNTASNRDPAWRGFCKRSHIMEYAALSKTPRALAYGPMLVFLHPVKAGRNLVTGLKFPEHLLSCPHRLA